MVVEVPPLELIFWRENHVVKIDSYWAWWFYRKIAEDDEYEPLKEWDGEWIDERGYWHYAAYDIPSGLLIRGTWVKIPEMNEDEEKLWIMDLQD
jgi:hypothetical protein